MEGDLESEIRDSDDGKEQEEQDDENEANGKEEVKEQIVVTPQKEETLEEPVSKLKVDLYCDSFRLLIQ